MTDAEIRFVDVDCKCCNDCKNCSIMTIIPVRNIDGNYNYKYICPIDHKEVQE